MANHKLAVPYGTLRQTHPDVEREGLGEIRALYEGGRALLRSTMTERLFPAHLGEHTKVYAERRKRAFYVNHLSTIVDHIIAGLATDPLRMSAEPDPEPYYEALARDVSPRGGQRMPLSELLQKQATDALLYRRAWTLVDLPSPLAGEQPRTERDRHSARDVRPTDWYRASAWASLRSALRA